MTYDGLGDFGHEPPPYLDERHVEALDWDAVNWLEGRGLIEGERHPDGFDYRIFAGLKRVGRWKRRKTWNFKKRGFSDGDGSRRRAKRAARTEPQEKTAPQAGEQQAVATGTGV